MADVYYAEDELLPEAETPELETGAGGGLGRLQKAALLEAVDAHLDDQKLAEIGARVVQDWERDKADNKEWRTKTEAALNAAAQEIPLGEDGQPTAKNYPWPGAADVRYPLLTISSLAFSSRAAPAIIKGDEAVKCKTFGKSKASEKQSRAERVASYMNWKLFYGTEGWEQDTDAMLVRLPAAGQGFRKVWWDPIKRKCCVESISPLRLTIPPSAKDLKSSPRVTHDYDRYPYELQRLMQAGHFRDVVLAPEGDDDQAPRVILEQHRYMDLDDDGVDEPYIVTVDAKEAVVLRIDEGWDDDALERDPETNEILDIERSLPFVSYPFIPDPKGRAYAIGFGHLLTPIMEVVNTIINLSIDAGHAQVAGGGFVAQEVRLQGAGQRGNLRFQPGEYKTINATGDDIRKGIIERTFPEPSTVLFQLLGLLMEAAQDIASVNEAITGDASRNAPVGTTLALIEQGQQVFNAIYKRIYAGLRDEFRLFAECLRKYGDPMEYANFVDLEPPSQMGHNGGPPMAPEGDPQGLLGAAQPQQPAQPIQITPEFAQQLFESDFNFDDLDIRPISDPSSVTKSQQMAKMQVALGFLGQGIYADDRAVVRKALELAGIEEADEWIPENPPPNPMAEAAAKLQMALAQVEIQLKGAQASKLQADAQVAQAGVQMDAAKTEADVTLKGAQTAKIVDELQGQSAIERARQAASDIMTDEVDRQATRAETAMKLIQPQVDAERDERAARLNPKEKAK